MRYLIIVTILFICFFGKLFAHSYSGTIDYRKSSIKYQLKLMEIDNQTNAFLTSIDMNAYEIPCQNARFINDSLSFYVVSDY